jgi:membrane protein
MIFLVGLLDLVEAHGALRDFLEPIAPDAVLETVDALQEDASPEMSAVAFAIGATGALWAASGAMSTIVKAVNRAYERVETRPFWKTRLTGVLLVGLTGLTTAALVLLIVFGGPLGEAIAEQAGLGSEFETVWTVVRWPLALITVLLLFAIVYYLAPNADDRRWRWISPGSLVGALSWIALSGLFSLYANFSDSFSRTYGALASGIVLLLWLNYSAFALLFGAELNSELERRRGLVEPSRRT